MLPARSQLVLGLRRVRLLAAAALAHQNKMSEEHERLLGLLAEARRAEQAVPNDGPDGPATLPLSLLTRRLGLGPLEVEVLLAAVALEIDPAFAITLSALCGEEPRRGLHKKALGQLFRLSGDDGLELGLGLGLGATLRAHPLFRSGLLVSDAGEEVPETLRPFRASARLTSFLSGDDGLDPLLLRCGELLTAPADLDLDHARAALDLLVRVLSAGEEVIVCLEGPEGVGRRTLVAAAARALGPPGRPVLAVDGGRLAAERAPLRGQLLALRRECWLRGAVPVVARLDALGRRGPHAGEAAEEVAAQLEEPGALPGPLVVTVARGGELPDFRRRVLRLPVDPPGPAARARIWGRALSGPGSPGGPGLETGAAPAPVLPELAEVVERYALTPAGIHRAAANARLLGQGRALGAADIRGGVAVEIQERFAGLATRVQVPQRWEDLVLPRDTLDDVKAFASRASNTHLVYDRWGFRDKLGRGLGLAALFSGPPGTGKTLVACLIAQSLGLPAYAVDLAQVVSKWVGETEKQLGRIFDAAAMGHVLLLFDEADALFARRTEVKSANDRYANLEVNYLLQRIEAFSGVAILTTNLDASVDPAFKRRLAAEIRFYPPDLDERERLWRTLLPDRAPVAEPLDFARLAATYKELCGGHIRNAVLRAAFLAAAEAGPGGSAGPAGPVITQQILHRAARAEYRAMGKVL